MPLSLPLRAGARYAGAVALAFAIFASLPAHAGEAAESIAGKFAVDDDKASGEERQDANWLHEEAKRAVERALEQENARNGDAVAPAVSEPPATTEIKTTEPAASPSLEVETERPQAEPDKAPGTSREIAPSPVVNETAVEATGEGRPADEAGQQQPRAEDGKKLETEGKELADKLRDVRRKHDAEAAGGDQAPSERPAEEPGIVAKAVSGIATQVAGYISPLVEKRVSILIVMEVGHDGVRKWSKTADPMLCIHENCYLSTGADQPAEKLTRSIAFGPGVALGKRGLACRSKPACIFRDIDLETVEAKLQPVDLRFLHHDRREAKTIRADATCAIFDGALSCREPVAGDDWKAWIVPESVATRAGASGLAAALAKGLQ